MKKNSELTTRVVTAAIYVGVMAVFIIPGRWVPLIPIILWMAIAFLTSFEKSRAVNLRLAGMGVVPIAIASVLLGLTAFTGILSGTFLRGLPLSIDATVNTMVAPRIFGYYALFALFILPLAGLIRMWRGSPEQLPHTVAESMLVVSASMPIASAIALLYGCKLGWHWFVLAILTAWVSDTGSYFAGRFLGRKRFAPVISPNKTWEGTVGGILGTMILYLIYFPLVIGKSLGYSTWASVLFAALAAILMSFVATFGDLKSSALKRWCGIKDFGTLLPGHGGVSDRFDSTFATQPAMLLLAILASAIA
ncbi:MAG TPA: CDP-archaeol synthase [Clostridia bacterium]|nr:CDP-archaeol synthase [Clostridia bacterium]